MARLQRRNLGERFTEGARQTWIALERRRKRAGEDGGDPWDHAYLARALKIGTATLHRVMYGDRDPDAKTVIGIERLLGVPCRLWVLAPKNHFVPPAARGAA